MTPATRHLFRRQPLHLLLVLALLFLALRWPGPGPLAGSVLGVSTANWFYLGIAIAVVHQVYVWWAWRVELGWQLITRRLGSRTGFGLFRAVFMLLLVSRPIPVAFVAVADEGTLYEPGWVAWAAAGILAIVAGWAMGSVVLFFGVTRATGADHFDRAYRDLPFVREGAFRYVPNAMYVLVFLAFWAMAVGSGSRAAFVLAAFNHAYIWVHYWCTERPDMDVIYGDRLERLRRGAE